MAPLAGHVAGLQRKELLADGWQVIIEPNVVHAFEFDGEPDGSGYVALVIARAALLSVEDTNIFPVKLVDPSALDNN